MHIKQDRIHHQLVRIAYRVEQTKFQTHSKRTIFADPQAI